MVFNAMVHPPQSFPAKVLWGAVFSTLLVTSCGSRMESESGSIASKVVSAPAPAAMNPAPAEFAQDLAQGRSSADSTANSNQPASSADRAKNTASKPQLVKSASLSLSVNSVTEALKKTRAIVTQHQGDFLGLQDSPASANGDRHTLSIQIRVAQDQLDSTLESLSQIGTIQTRGLTAEDVSDQLVDFDARLRNLRKTESTLLTIMDRSGSVGDVLKVAQELSRVRDETERITAQISNLNNRVTFSHISLSLEEVVASQKPQRPFGAEFQEAWEDSTHSMTQLTMSLGKLGIWSVAYTPYWLGLGVLLFAWKTRSLPWQKPRPQLATLPSSPPSEEPPSE